MSKININSVNELDEISSDFSAKSILKESYQNLRSLAGNAFPYLVTERWVYRLSTKCPKDEEKIYFVHPISTYVKIANRLINIDNGETSYNIEISNGFLKQSLHMNADVLTATGAKELLKRGVIFNENSSKFLIEYLVKSSLIAPVQTIYKDLGWLEHNNNLIFRTGNLITDNLKLKNSIYSGVFDLSPHGSEFNYLNMIRQEVIKKMPLLFVLVLGFASPILSLINNERDTGGMIFNLSNSSSKGKTTAAMLSASVFSNPVFNQGTLISCNGTSNALLNFATICNGHTIVFDEIATNDCKNFRRLLYTLCSGRDKLRLNSDSELKTPKSFNSVILTTAEFSIVDETAPNGIRTRIFEITDELTSSAENSEMIKTTVLSNYALFGSRFVEFILKEKFQILLSDYDSVVSELKACYNAMHYNIGELTLRILSKLSVIVLTAKYVNQFFSEIGKDGHGFASGKILYRNIITTRNSDPRRCTKDR